jgi:hypothetical protein
MVDAAKPREPTARVKLVQRPGDYPGALDAETRKDLDALFGHMFPGASDPQIAGTGAVFGVVAQDPKMALALVKTSDHFVQENEFTVGRNDLRQLLIQTLCYHFKCDFNFTSHIKAAVANGLTVEQQALIPFWKTTNVFTDEQRLVIEYTYAVCGGEVPEELFARVVKQFGEKGAIQCTTAIAWWSFWGMIANATQPHFDFGYGPAR